MRQFGINRIYLAVFVLLFVSASLITVVMQSDAQGIFATNTPVGDSSDTATDDESGSAPMMFATNTPAVDMSGEVSTGVAAPQAPLFNYGMRVWLQAEFVPMVLNQVQMLEEGDEDRQLAANILLYEMEQRFPSAPSSPELRQQFIEAMINAPLGSLDMRQMMFPFIQNTIDANPTESMIEINGFAIALIPANLDGTGELDRVVNVLYEQDGVVRYNEYLLATANDAGSFTVLPTTYNLPSVPYGGINRVSVEYLRDVNADSLDELVLRVDDDQASDLFYIVEYRNGRAVNLVDPTTELRVGEIINWAVDTPTTTAPELVVFEYQAVSSYPDWQCANQIEYTWRYERNLYRRSQGLNTRFTNVDSLGCTLANANLFAMPVPEAISTIEEALLEYSFEDPSAHRALMTLAVFYVLAGRLDDARNTAQSIITVDDENTWESRQARTLIQATGASGNTALDICEALAIASEYPACNMNAVIGNFLDVVNLTTDMDLVEQLNSIGMPVLESVVVSEIGRAPRTVVIFELFGSDWWAFRDGGDGYYAVEPAIAPIGFEEAIFPQALIQAPQTALDALLIDNDPARTLAILDNTIRANPDVPLAPSALYLQALAYEFTGDRDAARTAYYQIWENYSFSIWGQIAAAHLELR